MKPSDIANAEGNPTLEYLREAYRVAEAELALIEQAINPLAPEIRERIKVPLPAPIAAGYITLASARLRDWAMHLYQVDLEAEQRDMATKKAN